VPLALQTATETLAQKPSPRGSGQQVDNNDVIAVRDAVSGVPLRQRGPRLIEALTYRLGDHTTADAPLAIVRRRKCRRTEGGTPCGSDYLNSQKAWGKAEEERLSAEYQQRIDAASNVIWPPVRAHRRRCSIASTPGFRTSTPGSATS
jgi:pyruvate dehydrogenase E1 component alpha subunit